MKQDWHSYEDFLALVEAASGARKDSLQKFAVAVAGPGRALRSGERRVNVAEGYGTLDSRRISIPWFSALRNKDALGRWVDDIRSCAFDLSGAAILSGGVVVLDDVAYISEFRSSSANWRNCGFWGTPPDKIGFTCYDPVAANCVITLPNDVVELPTDSIYFLFNSNWATVNFGHFLHDLICQVMVYDYLSDRLGTKLRPLILRSDGSEVDRPSPPFRYEIQNFLFEQLVCPISEIAFVEASGVRVAKCFGSNLAMPDPTVSAAISLSAFRYARTRLVAVAGRYAAATPLYKRVYISRADIAQGPSRQFQNLSEAETLIEKLGFKPTVVGKMSVREILSTFYSAEHVLGIHGAGLTNFIFASESPSVTELMDYPSSWESIALMGASLGIDVFRVEAHSSAVPSGSLPSLDLEKIAEALTRK